jgi:hypothetical protein
MSKNISKSPIYVINKRVKNNMSNENSKENGKKRKKLNLERKSDQFVPHS